MKKLFTFIAGILTTFSLCAATYFASPAGSGDGKSYASPTTFDKGVKLLKNAGDTLYLLSGQYDLGTTSLSNLNGNASKYIVISGYEGLNAKGSYDAILDFRQTAYGKRGLCLKNTCTYVHIKHLTLRYSGKNNLYNEGSYCLFENLDIYGSGDTGCQMKAGGNNIIKNVDSHDNFDYQNAGGNADGFADKQFSGPGNHYIGCRAWNNSDDGWDFFQRVSSSQSVIEHCVCYINGMPYYDLSSYPRATGVDKSYFEGKDLKKIQNNGNGNGFKLGGGSTLHNAVVHHCLAVANHVKGFDQNSNAGTLYLYNNTAYMNGSADGGSDYGFYNDNGCALYIHNCISFKTVNKNSFNAGIVKESTHNTWNNGFSVSASDFQSLDTTLILAKRQADGSLPENAFMRLKAGSALIDAGVDKGLAYNGSAPDIGCYESDGEPHDPDPIDPTPGEQPEGTHAVAYVTVPNSEADKGLLAYLRKNDSLWIVETNAADASVDYSPYEVLVLGSVPNSSLPGINGLKGYPKPMVVLKSFMLKPTIWEWGVAKNTQDLSISVGNSSHPLFKGVTLTDGQVQLFSQCATNAVTAISEWTNTTGVITLAAPVSEPDYTTVAEIPAGTNCNGTVLQERLILIGLSEASFDYLTTDAMRMVENAILYQLGIDPTTAISTLNARENNYKFIENGRLYIQVGEAVYDISGRRMDR